MPINPAPSQRLTCTKTSFILSSRPYPLVTRSRAGFRNHSDSSTRTESDSGTRRSMSTDTRRRPVSTAGFNQVIGLTRLVQRWAASRDDRAVFLKSKEGEYGVQI